MSRTHRFSSLAAHHLAAWAVGWALSASAQAHGSTHDSPIAIPPASVAVHGPLPAPAHGVTDLKFSEMLKMPIGPKGTEPTERLLALHGKKVRLVGYMAQQSDPAQGKLILTPNPIMIGEADESLSDDVPGNAVFVHLNATHAHKTIPNLRGLLQFTGTLQVGAQDEGHGRTSSIRLLIDENTSRRLTTNARTTNARTTKAGSTKAGSPSRQQRHDDHADHGSHDSHAHEHPSGKRATSPVASATP